MRLRIEDLDLLLKEGFATFDIQVYRKHGLERPKMTWQQLTERDCREWKMSAIDPQHKHIWRSGMRSAMHAASQLPRRGPTDVDVPLHLHVNQKSDDDDEEQHHWQRW